MISISIDDICQATQGTLKESAQLIESNSLTVNNVSTDTRTIKKNDLFIALKGPSFNAHDLLNVAIEKGASVLLVERHNKVCLSGAVIIEVEDTRIALGLLGRFIKQKIANLKCAAITGSNGKTTCKELLSSILIAHCGDANKVLATAGNFNNDIGLPLTLLRLETQHEFAVVELGANHIGEIAYTSGLAQPDVALVNNIMPAHLEGFGSLEGVAKAKAEIWSNLNTSGIAVVNLDASFAEDFVKQLQNKKQCFLGFSSQENKQNFINADVFASNIQFNELGKASFTLNIKHADVVEKIDVTLNLPGQHNVSNALAASTMAFALGCSLLDIQQGLNTLQQVAGRVNSTELSLKLTVIDDTYNANSSSVKAAIDLLSQYKCKRVLICGDMGELGEYAENEHQSVGEYAHQQQIDKLFTVGSLSQLATSAYNAASQSAGAEHFLDKQLLKLAMSNYFKNEQVKTVVLVKGSRSAKMEEIVTFIKDNFSA
ncbi:UDP-N-acetylmuramoyl-tripeptide--D-alanyl-D-alanine ligase [Psychromonas sp. RZ22]|uniref:UDP-N-acetylmuramoyl-tripeptide--D-alanyl-D- alanine ligase n=1 Tax=Psychromonas algarum TaxID=2555643 RepID=UPI0010682636|nr:UDP-N-acetylmuramoyl-tripeptide--D-alanyl-D-alanine ligase [Psychromonas sp. RZ22]TEW54926.1 UDP-N-acetylmuramoyl-tripeptide--D-alanyl-D-alanine ligase [Psychromonas sp. RZ22]